MSYFAYFFGIQVSIIFRVLYYPCIYKASILSEHGPLQFQWHLRNNFINVPVHRCSSLWYPLVATAWHRCRVVPAA